MHLTYLEDGPKEGDTQTESNNESDSLQSVTESFVQVEEKLGTADPQDGTVTVIHSWDDDANNVLQHYGGLENICSNNLDLNLLLQPPVGFLWVI